jgi:hypothetical protein
MTQTVDYSAILAQGSKQKQQRPPIIILDGQKKLGKTTWAAAFPSPELLCGEDGAHSIADHRWPQDGVIETWTQLLNYTRAFAYGKHDFKTLVADTLGPLSVLCLSHVVHDSGKSSWEKMGWGKEEDLVREWRMWLSLIEHCRNKRGMNIVLLAHAEQRGVNDAQLGERVYTHQGEMHQKLWNLTSNWADIVLYGFRDATLHIPKEGHGKPRAILNDGRWIATEAQTGYEAGVRGGYWLPPRILLAYEDFEEALFETPAKVRTRIMQLAQQLQQAGAKDPKSGAPIAVDKVQVVITGIGDNIGRLRDAEEYLRAVK